ncbi:hypothetical protein LIER_19969 [Lithospermum erythrorhizon]|uniref:Uncharacterized protein n=1 Tax=Lithospermum erythrorhizon TaxID=34254 RepID=A0AAV3QJN9_LITER
MNYMFAIKEYSSSSSGWTSYIEDNSNISHHHYTSNNINGDQKTKRKEENEEEDLSMISDAFSGPPHVNQDEHFSSIHSDVVTGETALPEKSSVIKRERRRGTPSSKQYQEQPSLLDDTASSPFFNISTTDRLAGIEGSSRQQNILDFSQGYSTNNHFQGASICYQEQYHCFLPSISTEN